MSYVYSASKNGFFPLSLKGMYGIAWPEDAVEVTDDVYLAFIGGAPAGKKLGPDAEGRPMWVQSGEAAGMTPEQQAKLMNRWVDEKLNSTAQSYGYDSIVSAVSWSGDSDEFLSTEGAAFKTWRSAMWKAALPKINDVRDGKGDIPAKGEFISSLPEYTPPSGAVPVKF